MPPPPPRLRRRRFLSPMIPAFDAAFASCRRCQLSFASSLNADMLPLSPSAATPPAIASGFRRRYAAIAATPLRRQPLNRYWLMPIFFISDYPHFFAS
jgi:hypothetical protein